MTTTEQRQVLLPLIAQAMHDGARLARACAQIGLSCRTVQRWSRSCSLAGDRRVGALRAEVAPPNKLSLAERDGVMRVLNSCEFKDLPPSQIVPRLADAGQYVASESTMYRMLHEAAQMTHRRERESAELASGLLHDICARLGIPQGQLTVHSDNGSPMKGETMLATMQRLGIAASRSRPSVSNDNPYSESLFRTLKYRPELPLKPFKDLLHARRWVTDLVHWYNHEHRHSAIRFVTPQQRHAGLDKSMLKNREVVYASARQANPNRWSGSTRNWNRIV